MELKVIGKIEGKEAMSLPLVLEMVSAGFPSPAEDYAENSIDLNKELIGNKHATFFVRVSGNSMNDANIKDGDVLIVDKSKEPQHNNIVIAILEGDFTVKRLKLKGKKIFLQPENEEYDPIEVKSELQIWGVVTYIIHKA